METGKGQKFKAQLHLGHCEKEKLEKNTINNQLGKKGHWHFVSCKTKRKFLEVKTGNSVKG